MCSTPSISDDIQFVATEHAIKAISTMSATHAGKDWICRVSAARMAACSWRLAYSFVDATFQSSFEVNAGSNSTADAFGNILVRPGTGFRLIPRHTGRLVLDYQLNGQWDLGGNLVAASGSYLHGDENNANHAGDTNGAGAFVSGSGWIPGYALINVQGTYHITKICRPLRPRGQC